MFSKQDAGSPRSSVVYGSIISYIEGFFNALGMSFEERQVMKYLFCVFEDMVAAPVLFHRVLSESIRCNKVIYGFSKPFCTACSFSCDALGDCVSRWNKVWAF